MITVDIVDDHALILNGVKEMLSEDPEIKVGTTYLSGAALIDGLKKKQPDVLILDIQMPDQRGEEIALQLSKNYPAINILILSNFDNSLYISRMLQNGALGYLLKNTDKDTLAQAIKTVYRGEKFIPSDLKLKLEEFQKKSLRQTSAKHSLTPRERSILSLLAAGKNNIEIAQELCLSKRTVENYRLNLSIKIGTKNTAELVTFAIEMGLT